MFSRLRHSDGFTIIELIYVVLVFAILAALAIPRFAGASESPREKEAKAVLEQIRDLERSYHQQVGRYCTDLNDLGFSASAGSGFVYKVESAGAYTFCASAAPDGTDVDLTITYTIDQDGEVTP